MEVLRRRRWINHLHVALGAEREESFQPGARVLGPLSFVSVRQEHDQSGVLTPLLLGAGDELIDDNLRAIDEVTELRFPHYERIRIGDGVPIFKSKDAVFGEERVVSDEAALPIH